MLSFKIRKSEYYDLPKLLRRIGAVYENKAYPSYVYINKYTEKVFKKELRKAFIKKYKYISKNMYIYYVNTEWLNYGPNISPAIKNGYILINKNAIIENYKQDIEGIK